MNELDKTTIELMEQFKRMSKVRKLYFYEWTEYYYIFKENVKLGLSKEIKSQFLELLLRDDFIEIDEETKEIISNMRNELYSKSKKLNRLKTKYDYQNTR